MKLIPFTKESDGDADLIIIAIFQGTKTSKNAKIYPHYEVKLGVNPLDKEFIMSKSSCQCWSFIKGRQLEPNFCCKHLKSFKKVARNFPEELE